MQPKSNYVYLVKHGESGPVYDGSVFSARNDAEALVEGKRKMERRFAGSPFLSFAGVRPAMGGRAL